MRELIENFPQQLKSAAQIVSQTTITFKNPIHQIVVTGLGGSGISGTILYNFFKEKSNIPIYVNKSYRLPVWVNEKTLVIVCSYSGNTEESLSALHEATTNKCQIAAITSGGKLNQLAIENNYQKVLVTGNMPPRAAFGMSFTALLYVVEQANIADKNWSSEISTVANFLQLQQKEIEILATVYAKALLQKIPVIYTEDRLGGVSERWRQQLNENSKTLCWHHVIPEMNHNEIVGWSEEYKEVCPIFLEDGLEYPQNLKRLNIVKDLIKNKVIDIISVKAKGANELEKLFYLIHLGDWISLVLSELKGTDPIEIKAIDYLKSKLSE